jgi:hypothetical protein
MQCAGLLNITVGKRSILHSPLSDYYSPIPSAIRRGIAECDKNERFSAMKTVFLLNQLHKPTALFFFYANMLEYLITLW